MLWETALPAIAAGTTDDLSRYGLNFASRPSPGRFTTRPRKPKQVEGKGYGNGYRAFKDEEEIGWWLQRQADRELRRGSKSLFACLDALNMATPASRPTGFNGAGTMPWEGDSGGVNTATGSFVREVPLTSWSSRGEMDVEFTLIRSSLGSVTSTNLGDRWKSNYDITLDPNIVSGKIVVEYADGTAVPFTLDSGGNHADPADGFFDVLDKDTGTGRWILKTVDQHKYEFVEDDPYSTGQWHLYKVSDRFGNYVSISRGDEGKITEITDGADSNRKLVFGGTSTTVTITDTARSATWTLTRNSADHLTQISYPTIGGSSPTRTFTYNTAGQLLTDTDRRGKTTTFYYDTDGRLTYETSPRGYDRQWAYNSGDTWCYDRNGNISIHTYASGALSQTTDEESYTADINSRNADGLPTNVTDEDGKTWQFTYSSSNGKLLTITDPIGGAASTPYAAETYTYNSNNDIATRTNAAGKVWTYSYYSSGALEKIVDPISTRPYPNVKYVYDSYGQPEEVYDGQNLKTSLSYNSHGDVTAVTNPDGSTTSFTYGTGSDYSKNRGNVLSSTSPAGISTSVVYDAWLRITDIYEGDDLGTGTMEGDHTSKTYDYEDSVLTVTDGNSHTISFAYNNDGDLSSRTNAKSETETYNRDNEGQITEVVNGRGKSRDYQYTGRGELVRLTLPDHPTSSPSEEWSYDGRGHVTAHTNAIPQSVIYEYDNAGRMTKVDYPGTTVDTAITYDSRDRATQMVDTAGTTSWSYNDADELTQTASPQGTVSYTWRSNGQPSVVSEPDGITNTYGYDSYGRPTSLTKTNGTWSDATSWTYDGYGRINTQTFGSTVWEEYGYDTSRGRLNSVNVKKPGPTTLIESQSMTYDGAGNLSTRTHNGVTTTYGYDAIDQLTSETRGTTGTSSYYLGTYAYDANGNRTSRSVTMGTGSAVTTSYTYDDADKLSKYTIGGTDYNYVYDAAGRPTTAPTPNGPRKLVWDYDSHLAAYYEPSSTTAIEQINTYDGSGTRVALERTGSGGDITNYLRSATSQTAGVLRETSTGSGPSANYTPGVNERRGGTWTNNHTGIKNVDAQSSGTGVTSTREYDAFGRVIAFTGSHSGPSGYGGKFGYQEESVGFKLLGDRWYDPEVGRFLTRDTQMDGGNWYVYSENNPLVRVDPTGFGHDKGRGDDPWYDKSEKFLKDKLKNGTAAEKARAQRILKHRGQRPSRKSKDKKKKRGNNENQMLSGRDLAPEGNYPIVFWPNPPVARQPPTVLTPFPVIAPGSATMDPGDATAIIIIGGAIIVVLLGPEAGPVFIPRVLVPAPFIPRGLPFSPAF